MIGTMWMFQHGPIFKDPSPAQDFYGAKGEPRDGEGSHSLFQQLGSLSEPGALGYFCETETLRKRTARIISYITSCCITSSIYRSIYLSIYLLPIYLSIYLYHI